MSRLLIATVLALATVSMTLPTQAEDFPKLVDAPWAFQVAAHRQFGGTGTVMFYKGSKDKFVTMMGYNSKLQYRNCNYRRQPQIKFYKCTYDEGD